MRNCKASFSSVVSNHWNTESSEVIHMTSSQLHLRVLLHHFEYSVLSQEDPGDEVGSIPVHSGLQTGSV